MFCSNSGRQRLANLRHTLLSQRRSAFINRNSRQQVVEEHAERLRDFLPQLQTQSPAKSAHALKRAGKVNGFKVCPGSDGVGRPKHAAGQIKQLSLKGIVLAGVLAGRLQQVEVGGEELVALSLGEASQLYQTPQHHHGEPPQPDVADGQEGARRLPG